MVRERAQFAADILRVPGDAVCPREVHPARLDTGCLAGFLAADGRGAIDAAIERRDDPDPRPFRTRDEVGIREVEPEDVVDLDGTLQ